MDLFLDFLAGFLVFFLVFLTDLFLGMCIRNMMDMYIFRCQGFNSSYTNLPYDFHKQIVFNVGVFIGAIYHGGAKADTDCHAHPPCQGSIELVQLPQLAFEAARLEYPLQKCSIRAVCCCLSCLIRADEAHKTDFEGRHLPAPTDDPHLPYLPLCILSTHSRNALD